MSNPAAAGEPALAFELALVCTGNQIRSPIAEAFVQSLAVGLPLSTRSLGMVNIAGTPSPREAIEAAAGFGLDISRHKSNWMSPLALQRSDAVVGFEPVHVAAAVLDGGARVDRTFMLRELVELLEHVKVPNDIEPTERARLAVAEAHRIRRASGGRPRVAPVADPLGRGRRAYETTMRELGELVPLLIQGLFGGSERNG